MGAFLDGDVIYRECTGSDSAQELPEVSVSEELLREAYFYAQEQLREVIANYEVNFPCCDVTVYLFLFAQALALDVLIFNLTTTTTTDAPTTPMTSRAVTAPIATAVIGCVVGVLGIVLLAALLWYLLGRRINRSHALA